MGNNPDHPKIEHRPGVSRRNFIQSAGAGAIAAVTLGKVEASAPQAVLRPEDMTAVSLSVNGRTHRLLVEPRWSLLYVIREQLGLAGTKVGCERGECGACTVLMDGVPRYACMTLALEAEGAEVTTVEGLMHGEELGPVQQAFVAPRDAAPGRGSDPRRHERQCLPMRCVRTHLPRGRARRRTAERVKGDGP
jgi:xanthine dehydrogenase YagT iron-sulfur-binding subunit